MFYNSNSSIILVSACLMGQPVRYDGKAKPLTTPWPEAWLTQNLLVALCPEVEAGLGVPRVPHEIQRGDGYAVLDNKAKILGSDSMDRTQAMIKGCQRVLEQLEIEKIALAILSDKSPTCGSTRIFNGSFSGKLIQGDGLLSAMLKRLGVRVFNQDQMDQAYAFWLDQIAQI